MPIVSKPNAPTEHQPKDSAGFQGGFPPSALHQDYIETENPKDPHSKAGQG